MILEGNKDAKYENVLDRNESLQDIVIELVGDEDIGRNAGSDIKNLISRQEGAQKVTFNFTTKGDIHWNNQQYSPAAQLKEKYTGKTQLAYGINDNAKVIINSKSYYKQEIKKVIERKNHIKIDD